METDRRHARKIHPKAGRWCVCTIPGPWLDRRYYIKEASNFMIYLSLAKGLPPTLMPLRSGFEQGFIVKPRSRKRRK